MALGCNWLFEPTSSRDCLQYSKANAVRKTREAIPSITPPAAGRLPALNTVKLQEVKRVVKRAGQLTPTFTALSMGAPPLSTAPLALGGVRKSRGGGREGQQRCDSTVKSVPSSFTSSFSIGNTQKELDSEHCTRLCFRLKGRRGVPVEKKVEIAC